MGYYLGIDIGTTYTAAAVYRDGRYEIASLGNRAPTIPSVVLLRDDEAVLTGEAAARRAATEPDRVAREFKRRIGDPTPIIVGGTPYSADALVAKLLRWVVDQVSQVEGGPPAGIAVSHPANWGAYKLDLLRQAISLADLDDVATLTEPEAAAIHYASQERVEPGSVIAVYDLGGGTFDAAVLRKTGDGWEILGVPEGIERLGGVDFDAAVFHHVVAAAGNPIDELDPDDPTAQAAVARLRQECIDAKEALSSDSDVSIPVMLPNIQTEVRLTRSEYESMVRPALADTITAMNRALRSAKVTPDQVTAVLLVGGSSRTPLVAELVSTAIGRPVAVDAHPKYGVALGAAITAAQRATGAAGAGTAAAAGGPGAGTGLAAGAAAGLAAGAAAGGPPVSDPTAAGDPAVRADAPTMSTGAATAPLGAPPATGPQRGGGSPRDPRSVTVPYGGGGRGPGERTAATPSPAAGPAPRGGRPGPGGRPAPSGDDLPPGRGPARRGGGSGRGPLLLVAGIVVALALAGVAYAAISGGDDPSAGAGTGTTPGTTGNQGTPPQTPPQTTSTTEVPPTEPFVDVTGVHLEDGFYRVDYETLGYTPSFDTGELHVHLFPDTVPADQAGAGGSGHWFVTDEPSSALTEYSPDDPRMDGATQMCAAVADHTHALAEPDRDTGDCADLPD